MTELIGIRAGAYPVRRRDNLKSSEELRSCQKQMARACLARRKLTQLGFAPGGGRKVSECVVFTPPRGANVHHPYRTRFASERGDSVIGVCGAHAPLGSQCASSLPYQGSPPKGEIQSSECVVFTPLRGPMCITPIDSSQGHSYQGQPEAIPTIR